MAFISFTSLNKNTYLLLIFIIISAIANIIPDLLDGIVPFYIDLVDYSCQILISLPFIIQNLCKKSKKKYSMFQHFSKLDYYIFALMIIIDLVDATIYEMFDDTLFLSCNIFNRYNIDIFLCQILSMFTSNSQYYRHHIVGQIIVLIPSTLVDIYRLYKSDKRKIHLNWQHYLVYFLDWVVENVVLTYKKYLMEIKFISPFVVCFLFAAVNLAYLLILLFLTIFNRYVLCFQGKCFNIFDYDKTFDQNYKLVLIIIISIICDSIFFFFYYNIFNLFTTSNTLFFSYIYVTIYSIKDGKDHNLELWGWILMSIAIFIIFIGQFIFLEIIELNFCDLNKYTRNNIAERAKENLMRKTFLKAFGEFEELTDEEIKQGQAIEFIPGYFIDI